MFFLCATNIRAVYDILIWLNTLFIYYILFYILEILRNRIDLHQLENGDVNGRMEVGRRKPAGESLYDVICACAYY